MLSHFGIYIIPFKKCNPICYSSIINTNLNQLYKKEDPQADLTGCNAGTVTAKVRKIINIAKKIPSPFLREICKKPFDQNPMPNP
jgi:hypothetical protein